MLFQQRSDLWFSVIFICSNSFGDILGREYPSLLSFFNVCSVKHCLTWLLYIYSSLWMMQTAPEKPTVRIFNIFVTNFSNLYIGICEKKLDTMQICGNFTRYIQSSFLTLMYEVMKKVYELFLYWTLFWWLMYPPFVRCWHLLYFTYILIQNMSVRGTFAGPRYCSFTLLQNFYRGLRRRPFFTSTCSFLYLSFFVFFMDLLCL